MLTVLCPGGPFRPRFSTLLQQVVENIPVQWITEFSQPLVNRRLLFAIQLNEAGVNTDYIRLLSLLRTHPGCLKGSVGGILVDGCSDLYTKAVGRDLVLAASAAGCTFPGRSLVEGTGNLQNFTVQAQNANCTQSQAYCLAATELVQRILTFTPHRKANPSLLVLHASSRATSNTLALWSLVREQLENHFRITEIGLRNGTLEDCSGCPYTTCLHFGEQGRCFYGGVMVQEVYPAILEADGVMLLCPNYNDALPANLTAAINRLTALYRSAPFINTAVFAMVVSGYSGGDIVAQQVVSAMNMNKGFWLPPQFCLLETANNAGSAVRLPGIQQRIAEYAARICSALLA